MSGSDDTPTPAPKRPPRAPWRTMALDLALIALVFLTRDRWAAWVVEREFPSSGPGRGIHSLGLAADGGRLVAYGSGEMRLLDLRTGKEVASPRGYVRAAASPDGRYVLAATGEFPHPTAVVLDCETGTERRLDLREVGVSAVAFSPDGARCVVATADGRAGVLQASGGRKSHDLACPPGVVTCAAWSVDGSTIAAGTDNAMVCLWEAATGRMTAAMDKHCLLRVRSVTFSADGRWLVSRDSFSCLVWDTGNRSLAFVAETDVYALSSGRRLLATARLDGGIQLWDLATAKATAVLRTDADYPDVIRFSPGGDRLAALFADGEMQLWDVASGRLLSRGSSSALRQSDTGYLAFTPDGRRVMACGIDGSPSIWDAEAGSAVFAVPGQSPCCVLDDRRVCATDGVGGIRIFRRIRPEEWWGVACLWHFWAIAALGAALAWSARRDMKFMRRPAGEGAGGAGD